MNSKEAFDTLSAGVEAALKTSLARHARAARKGDVKAVDAETELQRKLMDVRGQLQKLREAWPLALGDEPAPRSPEKKRGERRKRLERGKMTPVDAYVIPILRALEGMGGRGKVAAVLDQVGQAMAGDLNTLDRATLKSGMVRWRNNAEWARNRMREQGLIAAGSPRGTWEITEQGRAYLRDSSR